MAVKLKNIGTRAPEGFDKDNTKNKLQAILAELDELQNLLFAENKHSILVILQGMDASGKDGLVRDVFTSMNPTGIRVHSFKVPTEGELSHDFLWRVHKVVPAKGMIHIFNRSHYEDVLVTRVHNIINDDTARKRMDAINNFEQLLTEHNNTHILKFYLHVSEKEQHERLDERLKDPTKMWKYNKRDFEEVKLRNKYLKMYEECFENCANPPWIIVPSDQNWYKEYVIADALCNLLKGLDMQYPRLKE